MVGKDVPYTFRSYLDTEAAVVCPLDAKSGISGPS